MLFLIIAFNFLENVNMHAASQKKKYVNAAVSFEFYCVNNNHLGYNVHICIKAWFRNVLRPVTWVGEIVNFKACSSFKAVLAYYSQFCGSTVQLKEIYKLGCATPLHHLS